MLKISVLLFVGFVCMMNINAQIFIWDADDLNDIRNDLNGDYILMANIDLDLHPYNQGEGWLPIGNENNRFTGSLDGNGFTISDLFINRPYNNYTGLFGATSNATLENIELLNINVIGNYYTGGLVGESIQSTVILNCLIEGEITGQAYTGLLAGGLSSSQTTGCLAYGSVTGASSTGGLLGRWIKSVISGSTFTGTITGNSNTGGLIGYNNYTNVNECFVTGILNGSNFSGLLIGYNTNSPINESHTSGEITGNVYTGGLIGENFASSIANSSSEITLTSNFMSGGLIGKSSNSDIILCHSIGTMNISSTFAGGLVGATYSDKKMNSIAFSYADVLVNSVSHHAGGLVGVNSNTNIYACYALGNVSGDNDVGGLIGSNHFSSDIRNSYARGSVTGNTCVGGLIGFNSVDGLLFYCFSTGEVTANSDYGGLVGYQFTGYSGTSTGCYWDIETSGVTHSLEGQGRTTEQMTYPYDLNTFINWDFEDIWGEDIIYLANDGYPYLLWSFIYPKPYIAENPQPESGSVDVPVTLEELSWSYYGHPEHIDPLGFRVYLNTTGVFDDEDYFVWVPFFTGITDYSSQEILPALEYNTTYYWKVVPTTNVPEVIRVDYTHRSDVRNDGSDFLLLGDAENCPVWNFTTEADLSIDDQFLQSDSISLKVYPNPFNQRATIKLALSKNVMENRFCLAIYNIKGQRVRSFTDRLSAKEDNLVWNGTNDENFPVSSGIYFLVLRMGTEIISEKLILLK